MTTYQTTVQDADTIRFGSAKIEIGTSASDLQDFGLVTSVSFKEESSPIELKPDNAVKIWRGIKDHTCTLSFEMWEIDLTKLALLRGGVDSTGTVAGTPATSTNETHVLTGIKGCRLDNKNGDGTLVTISAATDAAGTTAVLNTDYIKYLDPDGYTCVARVSTSTVITDGDSIKVTYAYTPNASKSMSTGGLSTIADRYIRVTNVNAAGKKFQIDIYKAKAKGGLDFSYTADDGDEPLKPKIEIEGVYDTSRTAGDQLFKITDEQGA
jgi:hypothetical protein